MAFLVVLESMTSAERVAFILDDVFRYAFGQVAEIVGRTLAACRQLASSARRRTRAAQAPAAPTGQPVRYASGRVVATMSSADAGEGKTEAKDVYVIAETARIRRDLCAVDRDTDLVRI